jgi:hypothetical protein
MFRDVTVRHIRPAVDSHGRQVRVPERELETLVGHEDGREREALGRAKADFLHIPRGRVGVDPECHDHKVSAGVGQKRDWLRCGLAEDTPGRHD